MVDELGAENLEDGELWLPAGFFSTDEIQVSDEVRSPIGYCSFSKPYGMGESQKRLSSSNFVQFQPRNCVLYENQPDVQFMQQLDPVVYYGCSSIAGGGARDSCDCGTGNAWRASFYPRPQRNLVQNQVRSDNGLLNGLQQAERLMGAKGWAVQWHQLSRVSVNQVLPGLGMMGSHSQVGTGVFLPRISGNIMQETDTRNLHHRRAARGPPRGTKRNEFQSPLEISPQTRQDECRDCRANAS